MFQMPLGDNSQGLLPRGFFAPVVAERDEAINQMVQELGCQLGCDLALANDLFA